MNINDIPATIETLMRQTKVRISELADKPDLDVSELETLTQQASELKHMKDMDALSLPRFKRLREKQSELKAKLVQLNGGKEEGSLTEPCWECKSIEWKLKEAGVL